MIELTPTVGLGTLSWATPGHAPNEPGPRRTNDTTLHYGERRHQPAGREAAGGYLYLFEPILHAFIPIRVRVHVRVRVRVGLASEPAVASRVPHTARAPSPETMFSALSTYGLSRGPNTILTTFSKLTPSRRTAMI